MPRGKKGQYALETDGDGRLTPVRVSVDSNSVPSVPGVPQNSSRVEEAAEAFVWLLGRTDGWLRCIPAGDGKQNYFKWKFTSGEWAQYYVMFVSPSGDWSGGILGLAKKIIEVDVGLRRPAHDTFYDPR